MLSVGLVRSTSLVSGAQCNRADLRSVIAADQPLRAMSSIGAALRMLAARMMWSPDVGLPAEERHAHSLERHQPISCANRGWLTSCRSGWEHLFHTREPEQLGS